jgi:H-type small acid-soluble spore protein
MDVNRAQQIVAAADKINVTLDGKSVWIDSVDSASNTATVHAEHNPGETRKVAVSQLQEA